MKKLAVCVIAGTVALCPALFAKNIDEGTIEITGASNAGLSFGSEEQEVNGGKASEEDKTTLDMSVDALYYVVKNDRATSFL